MKITDIKPKQDDPQRILALNGVDRKFYLSAEEINLILIVLAQLLGNETSLYKGEFDSLYALDQAYPLPEPGSYAQIIVDGGTNQKATWDNTNKKWFEDGDFVQPGSDAAYLLKNIYDSDADGIIDKAKDIAAVLNAGGTKYYGTKNGQVGVFDLPAAGTIYTPPANYTDKADLLDNQPDQKENEEYTIRDASAWTGISYGWATFQKKAASTGSESDYELREYQEGLEKSTSVETDTRPKLLKFNSGWISGYQYQPFGKWEQDGVVKTDTRTLTASAADATYDRYVIFVIDLTTEQLKMKEGTAAANPQVPTYDPVTELYCGQFRVSAGTTKPADVNEIVIYKENAGSPAEFNASKSEYEAGHILFDDTSDPYEGTYAVKVNSDPNLALENFNFIPNTPISIDLVKQLSFRVKNIVGKLFYILIEGTKSNGNYDSFYLEDPDKAGYLISQTTSYQYISMSMPSNQIAQVSKISFVLRAGAEMLFDNIRIISGDAVVVNPEYATEEYVDAEVAKAKAEMEQYHNENVGTGSGIQILEPGAFTGELNVSGGNRYYDDYTSGAVVNLSLSATKALGATATVRVQGDLTGTIPAEWNFSGQSISADALKLNELTLLYISGLDIRIINRVVDNNNEVAPANDPSALTNLNVWYDGTDSSQMAIANEGEVLNLYDKNNVLDLTATDTVTYSGGSLVFGSGVLSSSKNTLLEYENDFHGFFIFKMTALTNESFVMNNVSTSPNKRFAIGRFDGSNLSVKLSNGSKKSIAFLDTTNFHKVEFKCVAGVMTAFLDDVEMTGTADANTDTVENFVLGGRATLASAPCEIKDFFVQAGVMTADERTNMLAYINDKHGL